MSAGPRGPETEDPWGYKLCIGPQCTATESERTAKHIQSPVWITERRDSEDRLDDLKLGEVMGGRM